MAQISAPQIIIFFTCSLLFTSVTISWLLLQAYGVSIAGLPFELPSQDSTAYLGDNSQVVFTGTDWQYTNGTTFISGDYLLLPNINNKGGIYTNSYTINNPSKKDYSIVLSHSSTMTQEILVNSMGFDVVENKFGFGNNVLYSYQYENANQLSNVNIKTTFSPDASISDSLDIPVLSFAINGQTLFAPYKSDMSQMSTQYSFVDVYYQGIGAKGNTGLSVNNIITSNGANSPVESGIGDLWDFSVVLFKLLGWGIEPQYLPYELNLLLIKTQEFAIGIGIIGLFWK